MILSIKIFLRKLLAPSLYYGGIYLLFVTMFKNVFSGLCLLVFLLPQANIYYKLHRFPYGWMMIDFFLVAIFLGILIQNKHSDTSGNEKWIIGVILFSYFSTWVASSNFDLSAPISLSSSLFVDWKNYTRTFLLYFFVLRIAKDDEKRKILLLLISLAVLIMALKSYRNFSGGASFSWDKRYGGPFENCGLGANHFGAFMAAYSVVLLMIGLLEPNRYRKYLFLSSAFFSLHPIFFAYSRGAYLGYAAALILIGILRIRLILVAIIIVVVAWQAILPESVVDRISMTETPEGELEGSAAGRLELWEEAFALFESSPVIGVGYDGFMESVKDNQTIEAGGQKMTDTHGFFVRTICEQGVIGISLLLIVFAKAFYSGLQLFHRGAALYKKKKEPLFMTLGLGFAACVLSLFLSNLFGDRFSYIQSGCYFWVLWGLVDSCNLEIVRGEEATHAKGKYENKEGWMHKFLYP